MSERTSRWLTCAVMLAAAVAAILSRGAPAGSAGPDAAWRVVGAAILVLAGTRVPVPVLLVASAAALAASGGPVGAALAVAAALCAFAARLGRTAEHVMGAGSAALLSGALFRLGEPRQTGLSAAVGIGLGALVVVAALTSISRQSRRRWLYAAAGLGVGMAVAAGFASVAAIRARPAADAGIADATTAVDAARHGDTRQAAASLRQAAAQLHVAQVRFDPGWTWAAQAIPIVGHQIRVVHHLLDDAAALTGTGAASADAYLANPLSLTGGRVDLSALTALRVPLTRSSAVLESVAGDVTRPPSPWVAAALTRRSNALGVKVDRVHRQIDTLRAVSELVPGLLGGTGTRRYFLGVQTPAELRGDGGYMGNFGELTVSDGRVRLSRFGRTSELVASVPTRTLVGLDEYQRRYANYDPTLFVGNATVSPDFPTVARALMQLYPQSGGEAVDGVVMMDPYGFAALLAITGPVTVPSWPVPLDSSNAPTILLHDQYAAIVDVPQRADFLGQTARALFDALTTSSLSGTQRLVDAIGPAVQTKRIMIYSARSDEEALLDRIGVGGALPAVRGDFLSVVGQNGDATKIDWYLQRTIADRVSFDPATGDTAASVDVTLDNSAPKSGQPPYVIGPEGGPPAPPITAGDNRMFVSVYSPLSLISFSVEGKNVSPKSAIELGRNVYTVLVTTPSGQQTHLHLELSGHVRPGPYLLDVASQPMVHPDRLDFALHLPAQSRRPVSVVGGASSAGTVTLPDVLDRNRSLRVDFGSS